MARRLISCSPGSTTQGNAAWYLTDGRPVGSVRDIVTASGWATTVINHIDYTGTGKVTNETAPANGDDWGWTGRLFNDETGLQDNRARQYDPEIGRFWGEDPLRHLSGDENLFRYGRNSATNAQDPSGLDFIYLWSKDAALGWGHAAILVGGPLDKELDGKGTGWTYYSFPYKGKGNNLRIIKFKTLLEALESKEFKRNNYVELLWWHTTAQDDAKAHKQAKEWADMEFNLTLGKDCVDMVADVIRVIDPNFAPVRTKAPLFSFRTLSIVEYSNSGETLKKYKKIFEEENAKLPFDPKVRRKFDHDTVENFRNILEWFGKKK